MSDVSDATPIPPTAADERKAELEAYKAVNEAISPRFWKAVHEKGQDITNNGLMMYGDPKEYREHVAMAGAVVEGVMLWALKEGYLTLPAEYEATIEESMERAANEAAATVQREAAMEQLKGLFGGNDAPGYL